MIKTVTSDMWEIGPTGSTAEAWFRVPKTDDRTRWFYHGNPCSLVMVAIANRRVVAIRVSADDGEHTVREDDVGAFPGVGYEVPGDA